MRQKEKHMRRRRHVQCRYNLDTDVVPYDESNVLYTRNYLAMYVVLQTVQDVYSVVRNSPLSTHCADGFQFHPSLHGILPIRILYTRKNPQ